MVRSESVLQLRQMFKKLLIPVGLLLVVAIIGGFIFIRNSKIYGNFLTLTKENGDVSYKLPGKDYLLLDKEESDIPNHSFVKTGEEGLAHVILPDDSMISLSRNTEMQVNYDESKTSVIQSLGNVWYRVQKLAGRSFEVETPTTVAAVRGTIFGAEIDDEDTVYVTDGTIELGQVDQENGQKVIKNKKNLQTGRLTKVAKAAARALSEDEFVDIPQEKKDSVWFRRNEVFNEEFRKGKPREFLNRLKDDERLKELTQETIEGFRKSKVFSATDNISDQFLQSLQNGQFDNKELCTYVNSSEFEEGIKSLREASGFLGGWVNKISENIGLLKDACLDGVIDLKESEEISKLYQGISTPAQ